MNIGDEVTVNAKVIGLSESGNPIIQFSSGVRVLVKKEDINTVIPATKWDEWVREKVKTIRN